MPPHRLRRAVAVAAAAVGAGVVAAVGVATEPAASAVVQGTAAADSAQAPAGTARAADFSAVYARRRSGVVIDDGGRILTNEHVVSGAVCVTVELATGAPPRRGWWEPTPPPTWRCCRWGVTTLATRPTPSRTALPSSFTVSVASKSGRRLRSSRPACA